MGLFIFGVCAIAAVIVFECTTLMSWITKCPVTLWRALSIIVSSGTSVGLAAYFLSTAGVDTGMVFWLCLVVGVVSIVIAVGLFTRARLLRSLVAAVVFGLVALVTATASFYFLTTYVSQHYMITGGAMEPAYVAGEFVFLNRLQQEFGRGDVVIYNYPRNPTEVYIHRIVGVPGDTLQLFDNRIIVTNQDNPGGGTLHEPYAVGNNGRELTEVLGAGEYFVLGDNRERSNDSRSWGVLPENKIIGTLFSRSFVWPLQ